MSLLRINSRSEEITRTYLRRNGLTVDGEFDTLQESITLPGQVHETTDGRIVAVSDAVLTLSKNALLVTLNPALGGETYLLYPGEWGNLEREVPVGSSDVELDYLFRVSMLTLSSIV